MIRARALAFALALICTCGYSANDANSAGRAAFARHCAYCHGTTGQGIEPWYPAMRDIVGRRDPSEVIHAVLNGKFRRAGEVQGHTIPVMPGWSRLDDQMIADITNFILAEWGDNKWTVTREDVAEYRGANKRALSRDLAAAKSIYFERCVGCHGSNREGASGSALLPQPMRAAGTQTARTMIHYGSSKGMPGFGVTEDLTPDDMNALAEFLSHDIDASPPFGAEHIRASLQHRARPTSKTATPALQIDDLFVSLRHDTGGIVLIDGPSKRIIGAVATDLAPHAIALSRPQKALYVLSRGGRIARVDLASRPVAVTSTVRVGFEARSLTVARVADKEVVVAAAFNPGHVAFLDAATLELIDLLLPPVDSSKQARLAQVVSHPTRPLVLVAAKDQGAIYAINTSTAHDLRLTATPTSRFLRNGIFDPSGRLYVVPTDDEQLVLYDTATANIMDTVAIRGLSGVSSSLFFDDPDHGLVWLAVGIGSTSIPFLSAAPPDKHPSWQTVRTIATPGAGSLYIANHPKSRHLWFDATLNPSPRLSGSVFAIDKARLGEGYTVHDIVANLDPALSDGRVLQPQFNRSGDEVWLTIWNRQDERSAVVVVDEHTGAIKRVIEDDRLVTPIRTFALWQFDTTH